MLSHYNDTLDIMWNLEFGKVWCGYGRTGHTSGASPAFSIEPGCSPRVFFQFAGPACISLLTSRSHALAVIPQLQLEMIAKEKTLRLAKFRFILYVNSGNQI
eukprot:scpid102397/ scgid30960/ 